jgi:hypothetical protein
LATRAIRVSLVDHQHLHTHESTNVHVAGTSEVRIGSYAADLTGLTYAQRGHLLFGQFFTLFWSPSSAIHLEEWASMYGGVFYRPGPFGSGDVVVMDPVAAAHVLQKGTVRSEVYTCDDRPTYVK